MTKEISLSYMPTDDTKTDAERMAELGGLSGPGPVMSIGDLIERMAILDPTHASGLHRAFKDAGWSRDDFKSTRVLVTPDFDSDDDGKTIFKCRGQDDVSGLTANSGWTPQHSYAVDDRVTGPNPLRWYDRLLMWCGFKRWSPATAQWKRVETWPPMPEGRAARRWRG
jgi:hypothetical protein